MRFRVSVRTVVLMPLGLALVCSGASAGLANRSLVETSAQPAPPRELVLHRFQQSRGGALPEATLAIDRADVLYGTTRNGGKGTECTERCGTVFKLRRSAMGYTSTVIHDFRGSDGGFPLAGVLVEKRTGALYGTTPSGGMGNGTAFKLTPTGNGYSEAVLHFFHGSSDGLDPVGGLIADASGALYGTTFGGGAGFGTVFKLTPSASGYTETILYAFRGGNDGEFPMDRLVADKAGALYGTTANGGQPKCSVSSFPGCGIVFKLTPSTSGYTESVLHRFQAGSDGAYPYAGVIVDATGSLYGTTVLGGVTTCNGGTGCGTVYKLTPSGGRYTESILHAFVGGSDGVQPYADLIADASGALYGTTYGGGTGLGGIAFKLTPSGSLYGESVLYQFQRGRDGAGPIGGLVAGDTGALYGATTFGGGACKLQGSTGCGMAFKLTP